MQFLNPNVFYFLLLPLLLLMILIVSNKENIQLHFSKNILDKLTVNNKSMAKTTRNILYFLVLVLFVISLSRPVINEKEQNLKQNLIPVVVALDVSKSMQAEDIYPNRIELAKKKLQAVLDLARNSTIGIVLFAKDSFILSPVTEDFVSLRYIVDNLDTKLDFANGSNISAVLEAVSYMLKDFGAKNLIILSDGGNKDDYGDEIEFAKQNNITVYTIGIATKKGSAIPQGKGYMTDNNGNIVTVKLNEFIKELSINTGGGYIDYTLDSSDINAILENINSTSKKEQLQTQKIKTYTELFYYPLALGVFLLFISLSSLPKIRTLKDKNLSLLLLPLLFYTSDTKAELFDFRSIESGNKYYENKQFDKAAKEYSKIKQTPQSLYNKANALYKSGKYKEAVESYSKIRSGDDMLNFKTFHNLGNSYVKSQDLQKAKESYEKALKIKEDKDTIQNLKRVKKELEKQNKKKNKEQNNKDKDSKKKEQKSKEKEKKGDKNKEDKSNKKSDKQDDDENQQKNSKSKDSKDKKAYKKEPISDIEEKKWMKILENKKTPIFLQKVNTKKGNSDEHQPW
ncbi:MAG: tetratricopeptide repeat protein [Campylobacterota bacterium]|nr:tetratricopeptide repeat protein [Campylobacterota bacterium]